jgi:hypothetical protein
MVIICKVKQTKPGGNKKGAMFTEVNMALWDIRF